MGAVFGEKTLKKEVFGRKRREKGKKSSQIQKRNSFLGMFLGKTDGYLFLGEFLGKRKEKRRMIKKNFKGRCRKRMTSKCKEVVKTYNAIQEAYVDVLEGKEEIKEYQCNVRLEGLEIGEYSSDFLCVKENGDMMVRECVERRYLMKPMTVKLLDASWEYWTRRGIEDWGLVIDAEK